MKYEKITPDLLDELRNVVGNGHILYDKDSFQKYGKDETEDLVFFPEVVLKPSTAIEISEIVKICNKNKIPVTPRGAGTGLSGGALPVFGGVLLSLEKFNKIIEIDERNLQAIVEPGVITQVFQEAVAEKGLFYPPDPSSRGSCFLGGNIAENAGGPKAVKYGVTRDYVLSLELVLPTGEIIVTGARVLKNSTGYNLTQLIIGSEGTLGIVTKIIFKLLPLPKHTILMLVPFFNAEKACEAVSAVFRAGIIPSALEFMERDAIDWAIKYVEGVNMNIKDEVQAHLLVEVDGNDPEQLFLTAEAISEVMVNYDCDEILFAETAAQKDDLWKLRRRVAEAVKANSIYKEEDTVVPRAELPKLLKAVKEIGNKYGFKSVCYGHAGDGNLHVNIIKGDLSDEDWNNNLKEGIREIFKYTVKLGGTISGEHGIGWVQKEFMDIAIDKKSIELQKSIKKLFDPNEILNPGKIFQ
ncbi:MAG: FAD-binding protein [Bacteroidetes bacterium]|nr:FAD-binding protein [Bacteroidota bacterium]HET6244297.1 FAD-linked oxidase C-terminal domain-containing protein [Bacteroidia bacterium]